MESPESSQNCEIPPNYFLREVFNKEHSAASSLPLNWTAILNCYSTPCLLYVASTLSQSPRDTMEEYIEEALAAGFILPSMSPAAAGFNFVEKKDGGLRPCIDYRGVNAITVCYPDLLPLVPPTLKQLWEAHIYGLNCTYKVCTIKYG